MRARLDPHARTYQDAVANRQPAIVIARWHLEQPETLGVAILVPQRVFVTTLRNFRQFTGLEVSRKLYHSAGADCEVLVTR